CSIANNVAKDGIDCMVIEKNDIASGTSSRCEGNLLILDKDHGFEIQMSVVSDELTAEHVKALILPFEYRKSCILLVCYDDEEMEAAVKWVETQNEDGLKFNVLEPEDIREESPYFAEDIPGGLECETDSLINPYLYCYSLIDRAKEYGLEVYTQAEVRNITKH